MCELILTKAINFEFDVQLPNDFIRVYFKFFEQEVKRLEDSKKIELNPEALAATPSLGAVKTCVSEKASFCAPSHVPGEKDAIDLRKNAENDKNERE